MNRLVIGIVVWNNSDDAIECANSLLTQTSSDFTILLLNNASTDSLVKLDLREYIAKAESDRLFYSETSVNRGTAGAFNTLVAWANEHKYDYVGSLNADAVADKNWVKSLMGELLSDTCSIAVGKLLHMYDGTIDSTGDFYTTWGIPGPRGRDMPENTAPITTDEVFGATGGGFIARTSLYDKTGEYDERFFLYYEDIYMIFRTQLTGNKIRYVPKAIAYHKRGASSDTVPGLATYNTFKNLPMLFWKNVPLGLIPKILPRFFLAYHLILGSAIVRGRGWPAVKGYVVSLILLPHSLKERWHIQRTKTVSTTYVNSIILHDIPPDQTGLRKFRKFFTGTS